MARPRLDEPWDPTADLEDDEIPPEEELEDLEDLEELEDGEELDAGELEGYTPGDHG